jgi:hypothetical protein
MMERELLQWREIKRGYGWCMEGKGGTKKNMENDLYEFFNLIGGACETCISQ